MHFDWLQKVTGHEAMRQGLRETACKYCSYRTWTGHGAMAFLPHVDWTRCHGLSL